MRSAYPLNSLEARSAKQAQGYLSEGQRFAKFGQATWALTFRRRCAQACGCTKQGAAASNPRSSSEPRLKLRTDVDRGMGKK